jgi:pimeloyl-ACP methyl ester carboxylesterase
VVPSTINYRRGGSGPPLVLLHGIGQSWHTWRPVIPLLEGEFDVIACDSPGFGLSPPLPSGTCPTMAAYVEAFRRFFDQLALDRPHIAGVSMGGAIALELGRIGAGASVCAFSPAGFWTARERRFCELSLRATAQTPRALRPAIAALARTRPGRAILYAQIFGYPARMEAADALTALEAAWGAPAFLPVLDAFDRYVFKAGDELRAVPVTVAWGVRDRLLLYGRQAPRARDAAMGSPRVSRYRPHSVLRRSGGHSRGRARVNVIDHSRRETASSRATRLERPRGAA